MIEKLNVAYIQVESDGNAKLELANKINELVDVVNNLQIQLNNLDQDSDWYDDPKYREQPADLPRPSPGERAFHHGDRD